MEAKKRLLGMTLAELKEVAAEAGMPGYAAKQLADWLYKKRVTSIDAMTNVAAAKRAWLNEHYTIGTAAPVDAQRSVDGTVKYLYQAGGGGFV